jgi:hypothetical protein
MTKVLHRCALVLCVGALASCAGLFFLLRPAPQSSANPSRKKDELPAVAERAGKLLDEILFLYGEAMSRRRPHLAGMFRSQADVHYREGRLLALAFPVEVEKLLIPRSRDASVGVWERVGCVALLGVLAEAGMKTARATLFEIAAGADPALSDLAVGMLYRTDSEGEFLPLYLSRCREDGSAAFDAVSCYGDAGALRQLEHLVATSHGESDGELRAQAQQALDKLRTLNSGNGDQILEAILDGSNDSRDWLPWALIVGKRRALPGYLDCLRRRLDRPSSGVEDPFFDHALVAFAEAGGTLTEPERRHLYTAGYLCDPKVRLEELFPPKK